MKATQKAVPRREEACAVCAVKDWLENRHPVYLFQTPTGATTTWRQYYYQTEVDDVCAEEDAEENCPASGEPHPARGALLVTGDGAFCFGPKERVHAILDVQRYVTQWPLIPMAELHASSVEHPDDRSMRWLLHSRRVPCIEPSNAPQFAGEASLPWSAGVGDKERIVWCCTLCVEALCQQHPRMPPLALANSFFGGRHHPLFREASLATRMLASSARLIMRQLFLGRGPDDEVHKGMTGNTMIVAQPGPSYEQVLPNLSALSEGMVVLFCKSIDDVSRAQMLVVNRQQYRTMVEHRRRVCPVFADLSVDQHAMDQLPENAVPDELLQSAQFMPEATKVRTTMQGPANRIPMFCRQEREDSPPESSSDEQEDEGGVVPQCADPDASGADLHRADAHDEDMLQKPEPLNEHETIVGIDENSCPMPLKLFGAWSASMERFNAEAREPSDHPYPYPLHLKKWHKCLGSHNTCHSIQRGRRS